MYFMILSWLIGTEKTKIRIWYCTEGRRTKAPCSAQTDMLLDGKASPDLTTLCSNELLI